MNPSNHGQCHRRRGSRDDREEKEKEKEGEGAETSSSSSRDKNNVPSPALTRKDPRSPPETLDGGGGATVASTTLPSPLLPSPSVPSPPPPPPPSTASPSTPVQQADGEKNRPSKEPQPHTPASSLPQSRMRRSKTSSQPRARSGSWSGVNESDDELERMAQVYSQPPPEIKVSAAESNGGTRYGSVSSTLGSLGAGTDYSPLNDSSTSNPARGVFAHTITADRIRRKLKFFFMNPMEKWHARRRFPWKLMLQVFKIFVVTAQLCLFAQQRYNHVNYLWDTKISFSHLFIKGWDTTREIQVYPPADGPLAVYKKATFFEYLDYAVTTYAHIQETAIGTYTYEHKNGSIIPPVLCVSQYKKGEAFVDNNTYILDDNITQSCIDIPLSEANATDWSTKAFMEKKNFTFNFDLLLNTEFTFQLRTIKLRVNLPFDTPECYRLTGKVVFNNHDHDGQILVELDVGARVLECTGFVNLASESRTLKVWRAVINVASIVICITSLCMCIRAIYRAQILKKATIVFFQRYFGKELSLEERMEFVNFWYILICINDILIIMGSFLKIGLESKFFRREEERSYEGFLDTWNICSLFLGLGNLLVWFGCLRYLGFFETYNVLILTLKKCFPNVLRYSICILMVFAGYCLCGWLVLGPYHLKFRSFSSTMECLYSLINGDDMFATFSSTSGKDPVVWWFSRIYLYSFISLFIYVILSLFIAIIMDAYETIKKYYDDGFPESDLMAFVNECTEEPTSGVFYDDSDRTIHDVINSICCCGQERRSDTQEYEPLIT
ncbi:mucolipin-3-like isoform X3 [Penaeus japonicus]|uniref:mucolipin-3-like isoform X3 n=1 Tax=Penaeus japonicus TaxID=27405 RepID=UPI001C70F3EB|nr:mucolipin-3-like isoform X3 [Penaeus japonicus]